MGKEIFIFRRFAEKIKNLFVEILFAQFVTSFIAICVTIYKISKHPLDYETSLALFPFVFCMMMELFIYCFYGNELMFIVSIFFLRNSAF